MSSVVVTTGAPTEPAVTALLTASHELMQSLYPAESNHYLSVEALTAPNIRFFVAHVDGAPVGCIALALKEGYGEVKSLYVDEATRGAGVGVHLLREVERTARQAALPLLRLETGHKLAAAHRLYQREGFVERGPFGDYPDDPNSLFMEKSLA